MLAVIRITILTLALGLISIYTCLYSLLRPFHPNNVRHAAALLGKLSKVIGLEVEVRLPPELKGVGPVVYICNHQNSYDIFTISGAVQAMTVSIGKKSLKWIPFFGQMYWLTGNILIDRANTSKALGTIDLAAKKIKEKGISVWLFPEGTRSYGRGLLPFKTGAFRTAIQAEVPIVPVCASNTHNVIDLNRWNNGKMIIEFLPPVRLSATDKSGIRESTNQVRETMLEKIIELSHEAGTELPQNVKKVK
ncbi:1-acylglycerol-3-phosphate O-acyltransferase [Thalassotalea atypica]|uniref:1-acylglycerol-3-phosphate O-acyltransferase n=1 Tax=Thalassotalea atypica TaxID=2054316 RepID=UPI0025744D50|nr:1-acylglycerol-3-phosphate O-acyltransferase [Thalassotalea atypica]